jgi:hypothetical protein
LIDSLVEWLCDLVGREGSRWFGSFEYVIHHIVKSCGHYNISGALHFKYNLRRDLMTIALRRLQQRYALLRANVRTYLGQPYFDVTPFEQAPAIPLHVFPALHHDHWQDILQLELNCRFTADVPLIRAVVLHGSNTEPTTCPDAVKNTIRDTTHTMHGSTTRRASGPRIGAAAATDGAIPCSMILTVSHDTMDGKAAAQLFGALVDEYLHVYERALSLKLVRTPRLDGTLEHTDIEITADMLQCDAIQPVPLPPPVDNLLPWWLPKPLYFVVHMVHFLWCHTLLLVLPGRLPYSASPADQEQVRDQVRQATLYQHNEASIEYMKGVHFDGVWTSGLMYRTISKEKTAVLVKRAKAERTTMGCYVYSMVTNAVAEKIMEYSGVQSTHVWGVMLLDMRPFAMRYHRFDAATNTISAAHPGVFLPTDMGVYISTVDYRNSVQHGQYLRASEQWSLARKVRGDLLRSLKLLKHFTSVVFAQYLSIYAAKLSEYYMQPLPCPSFSV